MLVEDLDGIDNSYDFEKFLDHAEDLFSDVVGYLSDFYMLSCILPQIELPFYVFQRELPLLEAYPNEVSVSQLTRYINSVISRQGMKKLYATQITNWLETKGMLKTIVDDQYRKARVVGEKGQRIGIRTQVATNDYGNSFHINLYSTLAQMYIINHLPEICTKDRYTHVSEWNPKQTVQRMEMLPPIDRYLLKSTLRKIGEMRKGIDPSTHLKCDDFIVYFLKENRDFFSNLNGFLSRLDNLYDEFPQDEKPFYIYDYELSLLEVIPEDVSISHLTRYINSVISRPGMKELKVTKITNWLVDAKMLETIVDNDGKIKKVVGEEGWRIGIRTVQMRNDLGAVYPLNLYSPRAQSYIFKNLLWLCNDNPF